MLQILLAEDENSWQHVITEKLDAIIGSNNYRVTTVETKRRALEIADEQMFDFALIDSKMPVDDPQGALQDDAAVEILEKLYSKNPTTRLLLITQYFGTHQNVLDIVPQLREKYPHIHIEQISKGGLNDTKQLEGTLEAKFRKEYESWLRSFIKGLDYSERETIKQAIISNHAIPRVRLNNNVWESAHYFLPQLIDKRGLANVFSPDITLAASECFGVDGVKQATHHISQGYYKENDDNTAWHSKAKDQLNKLLATLSEVKSLLRKRSLQLPYLDTYEQNIRSFLKKLNAIDPNDKIPAVDDLTREVRENFRFGTSQNSTNIELGNHKPIRYGANEFEIYLPVHLVYEDEFKKMSTECTRVVLCSLKTQERRQQPITSAENKQPVLHRELVIFEQDGNDEYAQDIPSERLPDYFEVFQTKGFEFFGRMYLVLRRGGQLQVYDCTYKPAIQRDLNVFNNLSACLKEGKKATVKAFYIFEFQSWRQP